MDATEIVDGLQKWEYATPESGRVNHWTHKNGLSIRATNPKHTGHLAPTKNWTIEIYPAEDWPLLDVSVEIYRWEVEDADTTRRLVLGLILAVAYVGVKDNE